MPHVGHVHTCVGGNRVRRIPYVPNPVRGMPFTIHPCGKTINTGDDSELSPSQKWERMIYRECNEAVASVAGWEKGPQKAIRIGFGGVISPMTCWHRKSDGEESGWQDDPPDFLSSLDNMHNAEMMLTPAGMTAYLKNLGKIVRETRRKSDGTSSKSVIWDFIHMDACTKAKAFYLTYAPVRFHGKLKVYLKAEELTGEPVSTRIKHG